MIKRYTKKPVEIEAVQLLNNDKSIINVVEFVYDVRKETSLIGTQATVNQIRMDDGLIIKTLEGFIKANFNDYIIKGIKGEFYPCKPDIFEASYEELQ